MRKRHGEELVVSQLWGYVENFEYQFNRTYWMDPNI